MILKDRDRVDTSRRSSSKVFLLLGTYKKDLFMNSFSRKVTFSEQPTRDVLDKKFSENMLQIYRRTQMPKCGFNKFANRNSAFVFSCKFASYIQNRFLQEHLWRAVCVCCKLAFFLKRFNRILPNFFWQ